MNLREAAAAAAVRLLETALAYRHAIENCPPEPRGDHNTPAGAAHTRGLREAERCRAAHWEAVEAYADAVERLKNQ
jgi:hypothetical protein